MLVGARIIEKMNSCGEWKRLSKQITQAGGDHAHKTSTCKRVARGRSHGKPRMSVWAPAEWIRFSTRGLLSALDRAQRMKTRLHETFEAWRSAGGRRRARRRGQLWGIGDCKQSFSREADRHFLHSIGSTLGIGPM